MARDPAKEEIESSFTELHFVLSHPVAFSDFFGPTIVGPDWKTRHYQIEPLLSEEALVEGGRGGGKSENLEFTLLRRGINDFDHENQIVVAFRKAHVKDRMEGAIDKIDREDLLKQFIKKLHGREPINRQPRYEIHFYRRGVIYGCAVGDDKNATTIQGLHPKWRMVEEAQYWPRYAADKFVGTAAEKGTIDRYYGIRSGNRGTPWWDYDQKPESFTRFKGSRYVFTRRFNPYYNEQEFRQDVESLHGEDTPEFKNQIDGEWGEPSYGQWNMEHVWKCIIANMDLLEVQISSRDMSQEDFDPYLYLASKFRRSEGTQEVRLGIDVQQTEPTCCLVFERHEKWRFVSVLWLADKMDFPNQKRCIEALAEVLRPVEEVAFDVTGGYGAGLAQYVRADKISSIGRVLYVEWKAVIVQTEELPDDSDREAQEVKQTVKANAIAVLQEMFAKQQIELPDSARLQVELMSETRRRTEGGKWSLVTPHDIHIPEALRAFAHSVYMSRERDEVETPEPAVLPQAASSGLMGRRTSHLSEPALSPTASPLIAITRIRRPR